MEKHIKNDTKITEKKVKTIENKLNEHMKHVVEFTSAGEHTGQTKRIKSNSVTKDNQLPVLSGTSKDHKESKDAIEGPELRPIMGANVGPNVAASNFISEVIRWVADESDVGFVCKSTEELLNKFSEFNKERLKLNPEGKKLIMGSMDVEKWYPNTIPRPSAKKVRKMFIASDLHFEGLKYDKIARYLGKVMTRNEILEEKMEEILYLKEGKMEEKPKKKKKEKKTLYTKKSGATS